MGGANAQDHRAGKGPGGCEGWGLGSRNRRGPGVPSTPGLRGQGTSPGSPAGFLGSSWRGKRPPLLSCSSWGLGGPLSPASPDLLGLPPMPPGPMCVGGGGGGRGTLGGQGTSLGAQRTPRVHVGRAIALRSSPSPPRGPLPPASPDLPGLPPMPPRTHAAWMGLWRAGDQPGSSAGSPAPVGQAIALRSSPTLPGEPLPPASPDLPCLRGASLVWPPLLLPPPSPYVLPVHSGVPPLSLGVRVPHQQLAGALVVGRR